MAAACQFLILLDQLTKELQEGVIVLAERVSIVVPSPLADDVKCSGAEHGKDWQQRNGQQLLHRRKQQDAQDHNTDQGSEHRQNEDAVEFGWIGSLARLQPGLALFLEPCFGSIANGAVSLDGILICKSHTTPV